MLTVILLAILTALLTVNVEFYYVSGEDGEMHFEYEAVGILEGLKNTLSRLKGKFMGR